MKKNKVLVIISLISLVTNILSPFAVTTVYAAKKDDEMECTPGEIEDVGPKFYKECKKDGFWVTKKKEVEPEPTPAPKIAPKCEGPFSETGSEGCEGAYWCKGLKGKNGCSEKQCSLSPDNRCLTKSQQEQIASAGPLTCTNGSCPGVSACFPKGSKAGSDCCDPSGSGTWTKDLSKCTAAVTTTQTTTNIAQATCLQSCTEGGASVEACKVVCTDGVGPNAQKAIQAVEGTFYPPAVTQSTRFTEAKIAATGKSYQIDTATQLSRTAKICTPGRVSCVGNLARQVCLSSGQAYQTVLCPENQVCSSESGLCTPKGNAQATNCAAYCTGRGMAVEVCASLCVGGLTPGNQKTIDNLIDGQVGADAPNNRTLVSDPDRGRFFCSDEVKKSCSQLGYTCTPDGNGGTCFTKQRLVCDPGWSGCKDENTTRVCAANGNSWDETTCTEGTYCSLGKCVNVSDNNRITINKCEGDTLTTEVKFGNSANSVETTQTCRWGCDANVNRCKSATPEQASRERYGTLQVGIDREIEKERLATGEQITPAEAYKRALVTGLQGDAVSNVVKNEYNTTNVTDEQKEALIQLKYEQLRAEVAARPSYAQAGITDEQLRLQAEAKVNEVLSIGSLRLDQSDNLAGRADLWATLKNAPLNEALNALEGQSWIGRVIGDNILSTTNIEYACYTINSDSECSPEQLASFKRTNPDFGNGGKSFWTTVIAGAEIMGKQLGGQETSFFQYNEVLENVIEPCGLDGYETELTEEQSQCLLIRSVAAKAHIESIDEQRVQDIILTGVDIIIGVASSGLGNVAAGAIRSGGLFTNARRAAYIVGGDVIGNIALTPAWTELTTNEERETYEIAQAFASAAQTPEEKAYYESVAENSRLAYEVAVKSDNVSNLAMGVLFSLVGNVSALKLGLQSDNIINNLLDDPNINFIDAEFREVGDIPLLDSGEPIPAPEVFTRTQRQGVIEGVYRDVEPLALGSGAVDDIDSAVRQVVDDVTNTPDLTKPAVVLGDSVPAGGAVAAVVDTVTQVADEAAGSESFISKVGKLLGLNDKPRASTFLGTADKSKAIKLKPGDAFDQPILDSDGSFQFVGNSTKLVDGQIVTTNQGTFVVGKDQIIIDPSKTTFLTITDPDGKLVGDIDLTTASFYGSNATWFEANVFNKTDGLFPGLREKTDSVGTVEIESMGNVDNPVLLTVHGKENSFVRGNQYASGSDTTFFVKGVDHSNGRISIRSKNSGSEIIDEIEMTFEEFTSFIQDSGPVTLINSPSPNYMNFEAFESNVGSRGAGDSRLSGLISENKPFIAVVDKDGRLLLLEAERNHNALIKAAGLFEEDILARLEFFPDRGTLWVSGYSKSATVITDELRYLQKLNGVKADKLNTFAIIIDDNGITRTIRGSLEDIPEVLDRLFPSGNLIGVADAPPTFWQKVTGYLDDKYDEFRNARTTSANANSILKPGDRSKFAEVMIGESMGGNAGDGHVGVNVIVDRNGRFIEFGNTQDFLPDVKAKITSGEYIQTTIRVKLDITEAGPNFQIVNRSDLNSDLNTIMTMVETRLNSAKSPYVYDPAEVIRRIEEGNLSTWQKVTGFFDEIGENLGGRGGDNPVSSRGSILHKDAFEDAGNFTVIYPDGSRTQTEWFSPVNRPEYEESWQLDDLPVGSVVEYTPRYATDGYVYRYEAVGDGRYNLLNPRESSLEVRQLSPTQASEALSATVIESSSGLTPAELQRLGLEPKYEVIVAGVPVKTSAIYNDSNGTPHVVGYVEVQGVVYARDFYRSRSGNEWRVASHFERYANGDIYIGKGISGEEAVRLPQVVQNHLDQLLDDGNLHRLSGNESDRIHLGLLEETPNAPKGTGWNVKRNLGKMDTDKSGNLDPTSHRFYTATNNPDFNTLTPVGSVPKKGNIPEFELWQARSEGGGIQYTWMYEPKTGNIALLSAEDIASTSITNFGINEVGLNADVLTTPIWEYKTNLEVRDVNPEHYDATRKITRGGNEYVDASGFTNRIPVNVDAREAIRGLKPNFFERFIRSSDGMWFPWINGNVGEVKGISTVSAQEEEVLVESVSSKPIPAGIYRSAANNILFREAVAEIPESEITGEVVADVMTSIASLTDIPKVGTLSVSDIGTFSGLTGARGRVVGEIRKGEYELQVKPVSGVNLIIPSEVSVKVGELPLIEIGVRYGEGVTESSDWKVKVKKGLTDILKGLMGMVNAQTPTSLSGTSGQIAVQLFNDENGNGVRDDGEADTPWAGVDVELVPTNEVSVYTLNEGWNLVSFPFVPTSVKTAGDAVTDVAVDGGYITTIAYWDGDRYQEYSQRGGQPYGADFDLVPGRAYFVRAAVPMSWTVAGDEITEHSTINLKKGWNAIGIPFDSYSASSLIDGLNIAHCVVGGEACSAFENSDSVAKWDSGLWSVFVKRLLNGSFQEFGFDFDIDKKEGIFVRVSRDVNIVPD